MDFKAVEERLTEEAQLRQERFQQLLHVLSKCDVYVKIIHQRMQEDASKYAEKSGNSKSHLATPLQTSTQTALKRTRSKKVDVKPIQDIPKEDESEIEDVIARPVDDRNPAITNEAEATNLFLFTGGLLRQYQRDGYLWIRHIYENAVNGILADEMGLGKTVQIIATICMLIQKRVPGPFLIVAPLSTLPNWSSEFQRFAPSIPVVIYHGNKRDELRPKMSKVVPVKLLHPFKSKCAWTVCVQPVILTTYEMIIRDEKYLRNINYKLLVVDEGHRLKNFNCLLIKSLRQFSSQFKLLLTGTPLQNQLNELWSLLNFILPEIFSSLSSFEAWFDTDSLNNDGGLQQLIDQERETSIVSIMHQILAPFVLRRLKSDVVLALPPKREIVIYTGLTPLQKDLYNKVLDKSITLLLGPSISSKVEINNIIASSMEDTSAKTLRASTKEVRTYKQYFDDSGDESEELEWIVAPSKKKAEKSASVKETKEFHINMKSVFTILRRIVNHPYLVEYPLNADGQYLVNEELIYVSGKMKVLDKLLQKLKSRGHKVLIFSQWTSILDIMQDYLNLREWKFGRLDGSFALKERMNQLQWFAEESDIFCFLLTTGAGGLGINLVSADTAIIFDSSWNPQVDLQAQDRCHRIGQKSPVLVFRLVCANSIDERIFQRATGKRSLERLIIHDKKFKGNSILLKESDHQLTPEELLQTLQQRDCASNVNDDWLTDEQLDQLLDRSQMLGKDENKENSGTVHVRPDDTAECKHASSLGMEGESGTK